MSVKIIKNTIYNTQLTNEEIDDLVKFLNKKKECNRPRKSNNALQPISQTGVGIAGLFAKGPIYDNKKAQWK